VDRAGLTLAAGLMDVNWAPHARRHTAGVLTLFGAAAVTFMMLMYALERRGGRFILTFGVGCLLSSA
jgi:hypothetical protein